MSKKIDISTIKKTSPLPPPLNLIRRIRSDFAAVTDLQQYTSPKKKNELINDYINPILLELHNIQNSMKVTKDWVEIVGQIEKIKADNYREF
jgi:hypothetical protein